MPVDFVFQLTADGYLSLPRSFLFGLCLKIVTLWSFTPYQSFQQLTSRVLSRLCWYQIGNFWVTLFLRFQIIVLLVYLLSYKILVCGIRVIIILKIYNLANLEFIFFLRYLNHLFRFKLHMSLVCQWISAQRSLL